MRNRVNHFAVVAVLLAAACAPSSHAFAQEPTLTDQAQESVVYISFDVTSPTTGAKSTLQGTGFTVSRSGYVLTASHLFRDWGKQTDVDKKHNLIWGSLRDKPGYVPESPMILQIVNLGNVEYEDLALLKLPYSTRGYAPASVCIREADAAKPGDNFVAFGFPLDQNFQPVPGTLGTTNAPGGRWAAAASFTYGMSGGPVYNNRGIVIGLIKGGLDSDAVRWITPIQRAISQLQTTGWKDCPPPHPPEEGLCGTETITQPERQLAGDGKTYFVHLDFTRGKEKIEPRACGREIWTPENESDRWFGWKFVYLVDGRKRYVSQNLYVEKDDGTLEISKW
jgi:hypothetical protein